MPWRLKGIKRSFAFHGDQFKLSNFIATKEIPSELSVIPIGTVFCIMANSAQANVQPNASVKVDDKSFWDNFHFNVDGNGISAGYSNFKANLDFGTLGGILRSVARPGPERGANPERRPGEAAAPISTGLNADVSLVDFLKARGEESDIRARERLANRFGVTGEPKSAAWNMAILSHLKSSM